MAHNPALVERPEMHEKNFRTLWQTSFRRVDYGFERVDFFRFL